MSPKIKAITKQAPEHLAKLLEEAADQIEEALVAAAAEAQAQETEAKLGLSFKITLHLDKNAVQYGLGWSVKHTLTSEATLPDPSQPELPGVTSVTFSSPGQESVTLTSEDLPVIEEAIQGLTKAETQALHVLGTPDGTAPVKRGRGRPRKNPLPVMPDAVEASALMMEAHLQQASIATEPAQGEVLAPEAVSTDPEPVQEAPAAIEAAVYPPTEEPSDHRAAFVFDHEELENFVTSNGFTLEHCKKAAGSFNLLTGKESITTFADFGEVVAGKLLNARRGFASRMALIKQNEEAQNPPEI